jgi:hypothetical protein
MSDKALPTMSVRALPQHQSLIRDVARALRAAPSLSDLLRRLADSALSDAPPPPKAPEKPNRAILAAQASAREWASVEESTKRQAEEIRAPRPPLA